MEDLITIQGLLLHLIVAFIDVDLEEKVFLWVCNLLDLIFVVDEVAIHSA